MPLKPEPQAQVRETATRARVAMSPFGEMIRDEASLSTLRLTPGPPANQSLVLLLSPSERDAFIARIADGQVLQGTVEKDLGNHLFQVAFRGLKISVESTACLRAGQQVIARVAQIHPQVLLHLITEGVLEQKALFFIRACLPLHINWGELIQNLRALSGDEALALLEAAVEKNLLQKVASALSWLSFDETNAGDSARLKQLIEHTGLLYESKLKHVLLEEKGSHHFRNVVDGDLKGLLLELAQKLRDAAQRADSDGNGALGGNAKQLLDTVTSAIKTIELHQLLNCVTAKSDQQLVFQIPMILPEGIKTAELYVRTSRGSNQGKCAKDDFYIVFLLTMGSLGPLRIDVHVIKNKVRCAIWASNKEIAAFVKQHASELFRRFKSLNYQVEQLVCEAKKRDRKEDQEPGALKGFSLLSMKLLDITV